MPRKPQNVTGIPDFEIHSLARALLPAIQKLFEDQKVQIEFEAWKTARQKSTVEPKQKKTTEIPERS